MKMKIDIVKQILLQKIQNLESKLEKSFVDLNTNGKGKSVDFISKNGCKCKFSLTGDYKDYFIKQSIKDGIEVKLSIDDSKETYFYFDSFTHKPKELLFFNNGSRNYISIDTNIELNDLLKQLTSLYNFVKDSGEIIEFIETKLFNKLIISFDEFIDLSTELVETKSEFENYDNLMFDKWKQSIFQTGVIKVLPLYEYRVLYENETSTTPLGVKFIKREIFFRVNTSRSINSHPKQMGLSDKIVSLDILKKGKYKITFEEVYNCGMKNQSVTNVDYYFTERNFEELLIQIWKHNDESISINESIKVDLYDDYKIVIGNDIVKSDLDKFYELEPISDDYYKLTNRESLYEECV
jgi:hypothetical protein